MAPAAEAPPAERRPGVVEALRRAPSRSRSGSARAATASSSTTTATTTSTSTSSAARRARPLARSLARAVCRAVAARARGLRNTPSRLLRLAPHVVVAATSARAHRQQRRRRLRSLQEDEEDEEEEEEEEEEDTPLSLTLSLPPCPFHAWHRSAVRARRQVWRLFPPTLRNVAACWPRSVLDLAGSPNFASRTADESVARGAGGELTITLEVRQIDRSTASGIRALGGAERSATRSRCGSRVNNRFRVASGSASFLWSHVASSERTCRDARPKAFSFARGDRSGGRRRPTAGARGRKGCGRPRARALRARPSESAAGARERECRERARARVLRARASESAAGARERECCGRARARVLRTRASESAAALAYLRSCHAR